MCIRDSHSSGRKLLVVLKNFSIHFSQILGRRDTFLLVCLAKPEDCAYVVRERHSIMRMPIAIRRFKIDVALVQISVRRRPVPNKRRHACAKISRENVCLSQAEFRRRSAETWCIDMRETTICLLYTSPSPRDQRGSRMPSSA